MISFSRWSGLRKDTRCRGFGAITIVLREIMERAVTEDGFGGAGALALTYEDTIGNLLLSSTGGLLGSLIAV